MPHPGCLGGMMDRVREDIPVVKKPEKTVARSLELQTSARKMNQEKNLLAVIKFKIRPQGVIYIDGEKKGVAPLLGELQVKKGKYTIAVEYKNHKAYRRVVNLAPQERILIEHSFRKSTATAATKKTRFSKSIRKVGKAPQKINPARSAAAAAPKDITVSKSTSKEEKAPWRIHPAAFTATFTPQ